MRTNDVHWKNEMTHDEIQILCKKLNLGSPISPFIRVNGGLLHLMWRLDTEKGSYAIKQISKDINLNKETRKSYETSEDIARQFSDHGIPAISSITVDGQSLFDANDNTFIVYPWVDAKTLNRAELSIVNARKIASLLAKMHLLNLSVPSMEKPEYYVHSNEKIAQLILHSTEAHLPFSDKLNQLKSIIFEINEKFQETIPILNQTLVISHGDLDQKNVLWDHNNDPILIDWESARALNPTYELINAALDWSGATIESIDNDIFIAMIVAYKNAGGMINQKDLDAIFYGMPGNCLSWMVYNIQRSLKTGDAQSEERNLGIEQVGQVLQTIHYLYHKKNALEKLIHPSNLSLRILILS